jgi:lysophospholipase L1-like esterase
MKLLFYKISLLLITALLPAQLLKSQNDPLNIPEECRVRQGLPNFFKKLNEGDTVVIGYLGGSITAAGNGWRDQSVNWFQQQYPRATIKQINAGVGGTGSDLGVFRVQHDVLNNKPDLVFVEFAVNDGGLAPERIYQTMEGIVRQVWKQNKKTDICFVYTLSGNMVPVFQQGHLWPSMLAMEQVAQHYDIPSVTFGKSVVELVTNGSLIFQGKEQDYPGKLIFSADNVHPNSQTGHRLYTEALARSMKIIAATNHRFKHSIKKVFVKDNWEDAQMLSLQDITKEGSWTDVTATNDTIGQQFRQKFPQLYKSNQPGARLLLHFRGRIAGLYDVMGSGCGQYSVTIDGDEAKLYPRFDKYGTYYRSGYFLLPSLPNGEHTIEWKVADKVLDKMAILKQFNVSPGDDMARYNENACYAGWLLVAGKLKK